MAEGTSGFLSRLVGRFQAVGANTHAPVWLEILANLQTPQNTLNAYACDLDDFLKFCHAEGLEYAHASLRDVSRYINDLTNRPLPPAGNRRNRRTETGLSQRTIKRRIAAVRQFYDYLCGAGVCKQNPARRNRLHEREKALVRDYDDLPWIPDDAEWARIIGVVSHESLRNRAMFALNYDTGTRKEELCALRLGDFDHAARTVTVRAETSKSRRTRIIPYGAATDALIVRYISGLPRHVRNDETIFRSESLRNHGQPITVHGWTKSIAAIARRAGLPQFHAHTLRHLCLTDLARSGWDVFEIRNFAGHRSIKTTDKYIHMSGRELAKKYQATMTQLHSQRVALMTLALGRTS